MITILLVIIILALIGHVLEFDFSNTRKRFKSKEKSSPIQGLTVNTPFFKVPIHFNELVNILEMVGLNKERWIVDWKSGFELIVQGHYIDLTSFCDIDHIKTAVFLRGEIQFTLNVNCETGDTFIKTNSKAFETEIATVVFKAESILEQPKNYYGKATIELAKMTRKKLEEDNKNDVPTSL